MNRAFLPGLMLTTIASLFPISNAFGQDGTSNHFIETFSSQPASLLDLGLAKIAAALQNSDWPEQASLSVADIYVRSEADLISIQSSFEVDHAESSLCMELWGSTKRILSQEPAIAESDSGALDACLGYSGYFDPAVPNPAIGAAWYLDGRLSPCDVTIVSVRLTPRNGGERMICEAPFQSRTEEVSVRAFQ